MTKEHMPGEEKTVKKRKPQKVEPAKRHAGDSGAEASGLAGLQQLVGNRAVQRLLAQRSGDGSLELDDDTANRVNQERGGGHPLEGTVQKEVSEAMDRDFSGVQVHTSPESDALSHQIGARAFTSGQDVFFREGAYDPHTSAGQELIAHELTHVVQQSTGVVGGTGQMRVNAPGDVFEHQADAVAKTVTGAGAEVQAQVEPEEEEEEVQAQVEPEEEEEVQAQVEPEEEELQMQEDEELQMQEDEELQMQEDEELQMQPEEDEEDEVVMP